jgi:hypothetical protein
MAQTKRKRRTKHRGNAAGSIEARGRTGRKPADSEVRAKPGSGARASRMGARGLNPPSWKGAFGKALFGAVTLFVLMTLGVIGEKASVGAALGLCVFAAAAYTPVMYMTDRFIYNRKLRQQGGQPR